MVVSCHEGLELRLGSLQERPLLLTIVSPACLWSHRCHSPAPPRMAAADVCFCPGYPVCSTTFMSMLPHSSHSPHAWSPSSVEGEV